MAPTATETETITQHTSRLTLSSEPVEKKSLLTAEQISEIKRKISGKEFNNSIYGLSIEVGDDGILRVPEDEKEGAKYPEWLPTWNPGETYDPYTIFPWEDKGLKADADYKNLFPNGREREGETYQVKNITPKFGTEVKGIQLSELTDEGKNDLAKFVAERGVVVFRSQDLASKGPEFAVKFGEYFGPQHIHPTSGAPESTSKIHLVYKPSKLNVRPTDLKLKNKTKNLQFHSDVSYEKQPPALTFLGLLEGPETGGDTVFVDTVEAYKRLSPEFQQILQRLKAVHQGVAQAKRSRESLNIIRRQPVTNSHPIVRTISSIGEKAIYVNSGFVSEIEGLKEEESKAILGFLFDHLHSSADLHIRANWEEGTIAVWDNRRTEHSALFDWYSDERRHLFRITPRAEAPYL